MERSAWLNDIEVADDGTVYGTQTGDRGDNPDPATWQVLKITPDGSVSIFVQGAPLRQPNGIAFDPQGNIVVVNVGNADVLTFSRAGQLVKTENAAQAGSDRRRREPARDPDESEQRPRVRATQLIRSYARARSGVPRRQWGRALPISTRSSYAAHRA